MLVIKNDQVLNKIKIHGEFVINTLFNMKNMSQISANSYQYLSENQRNLYNETNKSETSPKMNETSLKKNETSLKMKEFVPKMNKTSPKIDDKLTNKSINTQKVNETSPKLQEIVPKRKETSLNKEKIPLFKDFWDQEFLNEKNISLNRVNWIQNLCQNLSIEADTKSPSPTCFPSKINSGKTVSIIN